MFLLSYITSASTRITFKSSCFFSPPSLSWSLSWLEMLLWCQHFLKWALLLQLKLLNARKIHSVCKKLQDVFS